MRDLGEIKRLGEEWCKMMGRGECDRVSMRAALDHYNLKYFYEAANTKQAKSIMKLSKELKQ